MCLNHEPSSSPVESLPGVEETGTPCNILLVKHSKVKRSQPREADAKLDDEFQYSHTPPLPPSSSLSKLPLSTSLCLHGCFAMPRPRCVCAIHLHRQYLVHLPSGERGRWQGREHVLETYSPQMCLGHGKRTLDYKRNSKLC